MKPDFFFGVTPGDVVYDIETYPNFFLLCAEHLGSGFKWTFEISSRVNQSKWMVAWLLTLKDQGCRMVGFNNIGFDYPVIHHIYQTVHSGVSYTDIYARAMHIIRSENRFGIRDYERLVPQMDLFKIHHFDNKAKTTSLKALEFAMGMESIEDLPFPVGTELSPDQMDVVIAYCRHDIEATKRFYAESREMIDFRAVLTQRYGKDFTNHNDTKIGKDYFIMELEKSKPGSCYYKSSGRTVTRQTPRDMINLADVILPTVRFERPEFTEVVEKLVSAPIYETKGVFKGLHCTIGGFRFDFGTGGIHGSIERKIIRSDDQYIIVDVDVKSYYPNLAIANNLSPAHLGENFCRIYKDLYEQRKKYGKKDAENAMLKLALNGVYGDSNNEYSPFYDPQYTMSITINGQLLLCMLAEQLMKDESLIMIQANTDGLTFRIHRSHLDWMKSVCQWWEQLTGLELEYTYYKAMFIRDVNNYIAQKEDDSTKRKGAYEYERQWHQDSSALIVPKGAERCLTQGADPDAVVEDHTHVLDFMLRARANKGAHLEWGGKPVQSTCRYYVSHDGDVLEKVSVPKGTEGEYKRANGVSETIYAAVMEEIGPGVWDERIHTKKKSKYEIVRTTFHAGYTAQLANRLTGLTLSDVNSQWYADQIRDLINLQEMTWVREKRP